VYYVFLPGFETVEALELQKIGCTGKSEFQNIGFRVRVSQDDSLH